MDSLSGLSLRRSELSSLRGDVIGQTHVENSWVFARLAVDPGDRSGP